MLDIEYPSLEAFQADCVACGYDAAHLLQIGVYVLRENGTVIAVEYLTIEELSK